jgi:ADP-ribose pyrophosphatase
MDKIQKPKSLQPLPSHAKRVFKGKIFDVYQWEQKVFDGSIEIYEKLKRADTIEVIPVTEDGKVILLKEEQPGKKPFLGVAGGRADEGEDPLKTAKRELMEETGYTSNEFILWDSQQPMSKIEWAVYIFIAKNCKKIKDTELDNGEKIELEYISIDEFLDTALSEEFADVEIKLKVMEAKLNQKKMDKLIKLLKNS